MPHPPISAAFKDIFCLHLGISILFFKLSKVDSIFHNDLTLLSNHSISFILLTNTQPTFGTKAMIAFQFFFFFAALSIWSSQGQESDLSHSCNLHCSCGSARSFNPLCRARDRTCVLDLQSHH